MPKASASILPREFLPYLDKLPPALTEIHRIFKNELGQHVNKLLSGRLLDVFHGYISAFDNKCNDMGICWPRYFWVEETEQGPRLRDPFPNFRVGKKALRAADINLDLFMPTPIRDHACYDVRFRGENPRDYLTRLKPGQAPNWMRIANEQSKKSREKSVAGGILCIDAAGGGDELSVHRSLQARPGYEPPSAAHPTGRMRANLTKNQFPQQFNEVCSNLKEKNLGIFYSYYYENRTQAEIATALKMKDDDVRKRLKTIRKRFVRAGLPEPMP